MLEREVIFSIEQQHRSDNWYLRRSKKRESIDTDSFSTKVVELPFDGIGRQVKFFLRLLSSWKGDVNDQAELCKFDEIEGRAPQSDADGHDINFRAFFFGHLLPPPCRRLGIWQI